jgi:hypothetical protein
VQPSVMRSGGACPGSSFGLIWGGESISLQDSHGIRQVRRAPHISELARAHQVRPGDGGFTLWPGCAPRSKLFREFSLRKQGQLMLALSMYTPPTVAREQPRRRPDRASRPLLPGALLLAFRGLAATALPRAHVAVTNCRRLPGSSHRSLYHGHTNEFNPGRNDTWQPRINEVRPSRPTLWVAAKCSPMVPAVWGVYTEARVRKSHRCPALDPANDRARGNVRRGRRRRVLARQDGALARHSYWPGGTAAARWAERSHIGRAL